MLMEFELLMLGFMTPGATAFPACSHIFQDVKKF
jgi:hypothetical protein